MHPACARSVACSVVLVAWLATGCGGSAAPDRTSAPAVGTTRAASSTPASSSTAAPAAITVRSPAFGPGSAIPARYSCHGGNTPPPLQWSAMPTGTARIALVMDDPDAPDGTYTHWVVVNLPARTSGLRGGALPAGATQAQNSGGDAGYLGPCPPSGTHHYRFTVYAEPTRLAVPAGAPLAAALDAIRANPLASGRLTGVYSAG